ncbi:AAA family ATPase [Microvirga sp. STR05]|uniref:AAA family ATPase n=1 Tax=Hymenobacter duratus TaxID=2771356 RepID=A0ABR8JKT3_9BACT|nr:AAA family ATPase [Hymenobacter duratus]MBD2716727.1 AAA family ATPase [Hymenobacter duratus]MBR7951642.1 AAA family ATPase [Microvirga sp. STR05]
MPRYLAFSDAQNQRKSNPLESYIISGAELLPRYFGIINSVNIFLGENNSGKSRFMREVMRSAEIKTIKDEGNQKDIINIVNSLHDINIELNYALGSSISTRNSARQSNFENSFGKLFSNDLSSSGNEIKLGSYWNEMNDFCNNIKESYNNIANAINASINKNELFDTTLKLTVIFEKIRNIFKEIASGVYEYYSHNNYFMDNQQNGLSFYNTFWEINGYDIEKNIKKDAETIMDKIGSMLADLSAIQLQMKQLQSTITALPVRTYIPTLRTSRTLISKEQARLESENDIFRHTTQHDYDLADSGVIVDTGFGLYEAVDTTRNARHKGRTSFKAFEDFLSATFFSGKTVEVVAERVKDKRGGNITVTVAGVERDIHDLGDGIQAIIMLLYPLFIAPDKAWFFIEEPETHLHPGFQRLFIETITSNPVLRKKQLTVFLTTHSNHILDFAIDEARHINLFTFRRQEGKAGRTSFQIQLSAPRDLQNLTALGVQNSSVFLANCTLWVEGITDRLYLRAYLQAYWNQLQKEGKTVSLLEGLHYTFLEYAGANVEHYRFDELAPNGQITPDILDKIRALSIANRIMLIADQDAGKQTRHEGRTRQQHSGFVYHILPVREIENLLTPSVLVETLQGLYKKQTFDSANLKQNAYTNSYIGTYLRNKFPLLPDSFAPAKGSGTIGSGVKRKFAEEAIKHITWDSMSPAARKITEEIHSFTLAHNPRLGSN